MSVFEPAEQPADWVRDVTLTVQGNPYGEHPADFRIALNGYNIIKNLIVTDLEFRVRDGHWPEAVLTLDVSMLDVEVAKVYPKVAEETAEILRRLGWTPPPEPNTRAMREER